MDYKGLSIETNAFEFNDQLHDSAARYELDFDIEAKIYSNIIVSTLDMQYYKSNDRLMPLASLRTTLKFWVDIAANDIQSAEKVLFVAKTQHRFTCFTLYQKLNAKKISGFYLPTPTDKEFFAAVKTVNLAALEFDMNGKYPVSF